jgi:hypothetical protein
MQCQYLIVLAFFFVHTLDPDTYDNAFSSIMSYIIPYINSRMTLCHV